MNRLRIATIAPLVLGLTTMLVVALRTDAAWGEPLALGLGALLVFAAGLTAWREATAERPVDVQPPAEAPQPNAAATSGAGRLSVPSDTAANALVPADEARGADGGDTAPDNEGYAPDGESLVARGEDPFATIAFAGGGLVGTSVDAPAARDRVREPALGASRFDTPARGIRPPVADRIAPPALPDPGPATQPIRPVRDVTPRASARVTAGRVDRATTMDPSDDWALVDTGEVRALRDVPAPAETATPSPDPAPAGGTDDWFDDEDTETFIDPSTKRIPRPANKDAARPEAVERRSPAASPETAGQPESVAPPVALAPPSAAFVTGPVRMTKQAGERVPAAVAGAFGAVGLAAARVESSGRVVALTPSLIHVTRGWPSADAWWADCRAHVAVAEGRTVVDLNDPRGIRWVFELSIAPDDGGEVVVVRDTTNEVREAESLRESEGRYALAAEAAHDALWDWDLVADRVYYSPRWASMFGLTPAELSPTSDTWFGRIHPEDAGEARAALEQHLRGESEQIEREVRMLHADGEYRWVLIRGIASRDAQGRAIRLAGSHSDVTERKRAEAKLVHDALYDPLTGLPNRALFMDVLARAIRRQRRRPEMAFAVLFLDIDHFKLVNDSLGHVVGDELLQVFAERLKECVRLGDTVARMGGDEFTILLEECLDISEAEAAADRIQRTLQKPFDLDGQEVFATASVGVAMGSPEYDSPEDILRDADTAMYRAKSAGKAQHVVFDSTMHAKARALLQLHTDLRQAVDRGELELQYQPIVALDENRLAGFEALVRWRHPDRGIIWPSEFIPVAEESGLIEPMTEWILREACHQLSRWSEPGMRPVTVSVNLSSRSVSNPAIVGIVADAVVSSGIDASRLKLEVTESTIVNHAEAGAVLDALKELGVQLYLDDFGTGYSSLSYLQRFNVDALKIDKSFVARMHADSEASEIVSAITSLAHNLGLEVIAEGVQTPTQLEQLRALGCDYGQGYIYSRPLDPPYARAMIHEDPTWD